MIKIHSKNMEFEKSFVVGYFRDTEGSDLISPKLSKGPDKLQVF